LGAAKIRNKFKQVALLLCLFTMATLGFSTEAAAWDNDWDSYGYDQGYGCESSLGGYGTAMHIGNFTYYDSPGASVTAQRIGNFTFYDGYNYDTGQTWSGSSQKIGSFTFYSRW
jgi:hypothetical protein